ncbi:hypothetical protein [Marisediminicola senii]|uniref:hypothetical protein n=1 Tax=Marisediminicola senii TaxID=2711233 RepID=UPI0013EA9A06|nr:hypothetical protein [Marisediminicola senii]
MTPYLSDASRDAVRRLLEGHDAESVPDPLTQVRDIRSASLALDADDAVLRAVRSALDGGETWEAIAKAASLGVAAAKWRWQGSDDEIAARHAAGRKRAARPSSVPTDLPGLSVADAAKTLGVTAQAVYLRITRGSLRSTTIELDDGRKYKRVFLDEAAE